MSTLGAELDITPSTHADAFLAHNGHSNLRPVLAETVEELDFDEILVSAYSSSGRFVSASV